MPGNVPAQITAKIVIASAKRLILVRQFWRNRNRIAEISVPAWPIPTQNTKLTIGKPQKTGLLFPQMPTPVKIKYPISAPNIPAMDDAMPNAMYHASGVSRLSAMSVTLSVIDS